MARPWSRGYLPHIEGDGLHQHLVIRTRDSLPRELFLREWPDDEQRFEAMGRALDEGLGSCTFSDPLAAAIVADALRAGQGYVLKAWVVMPNHAHALIAPHANVFLGDIVRRWKGPTARRINLLRGEGGALWARDYFGRYTRDQRHYDATVRYIHANPVKAGLCDVPHQWPWSSAHRA